MWVFNVFLRDSNVQPGWVPLLGVCMCRKRGARCPAEGALHHLPPNQGEPQPLP